jgi:hypothetical protein
MIQFFKIIGAYMVYIILDVVPRTPGNTLALIHFVGTVRTHITFNVQFVDAHGTSLITLVAKTLIVGDCALCTLTLEDV